MISVCGRSIKVEGRLVRIARIEGDRYSSLENPERILDGLRKCGMRVDLFTFMQILPETKPKSTYPMEWDNWAAIPVSTFDHWWAKQVNDRTRNKVRKAEKNGVVVRELPFDDALVQGIWGVYNECPVRQGRPYRHYGVDIDTVRTLEATFLDRSIFLGAFLDGKMIGFIKMVVDEARMQAKTMNVISMIRHWDKAPMNALISQAVRTCAGRGIPYLVYGNFTYGKKQRDSLTEFKQNNGFRPVYLPRYYVPLTPMGWAAFRLGLHHGFVNYLPEPVVAKLRALRNRWYNRRFRAFRYAS